MQSIPILPLVAALSLAAAASAQTAGMSGMDMKERPASRTVASAPHKADAVVRSVDAAQGKVTLAHGPVKSLGWPAMTMGFAVKDRCLLDKLAVGKTVRVEFVKDGGAYAVTGVE